MEGADGGASIGEEIKAAEEGAGVPRIGEHFADGIDDVGTVAAARRQRASRDDRRVPAGGTALGPLLEIRRCADGFERDAEALHRLRRVIARHGGEGEGEAVAFLRRGKFHIHRVRAQLEAGAVRSAEEGDAEPVRRTDDEPGAALVVHGRELIRDVGAGQRHKRHRLRRLRRADRERAGEDEQISLLHQGGRFEHLAIADGVGEHGGILVLIQAAILRPFARERTLMTLARIGEAAVLRPAGANPGAEDGTTLHGRRRRMDDLALAVAEFEEVAAPAHGDAHQVGVVADEGVLRVIERDDDALHRGVLVLGETRLDRAGEDRSAHHIVGRGRCGSGRGNNAEQRDGGGEERQGQFHFVRESSSGRVRQAHHTALTFSAGPVSAGN